MDTHKNASLTPRGREAMARGVMEGGLSKAAVSRQFNTTPKTVAKWVARFQAEGPAVAGVSGISWGHNRADGGRIWRSRRTRWTIFWLAATRRLCFPKDGRFDELKKALAERVLNAELDDHLDNEAAEGSRNRRDGSSKKTVPMIQRYQRRFPGFDDKIVSMYARGMTVREIQGHLLELYGLEVSPDLISTVTDAVLETVAEPAARDELSAGFLRRHQGQGLSSDLIRGSATKAWSATRLSMSRLASQQMERRTFSGSGSRRPRAPNSGSR